MDLSKNKPYFPGHTNPQIPIRSQVVSQQVEIHTGPIPAPAEIGEYERILPGSADRIIRMAEKEQAHRHQIESRGQRHRLGITFVGQLFAFLMGMSGIAGGVYLVKSDKPITGFGVFFTSLATLVGVFFYNRRRTTQKAIVPVSGNL
jgi:uncharacterized membrane protein